MNFSFDSLASPWWPYLFILIAGTLVTDVWRLIGVVAGGILKEDSQALVWVKSVATALVAGVVGQLLLFPTGELSITPAWLRIAAAALGWLAFWVAGKTVWVGVAVAEAVLFAGWLAVV